MKPLNETTLVRIIFFFMNMSNAPGAIAKMPRQVSHRIKDAFAHTSNNHPYENHQV